MQKITIAAQMFSFRNYIKTPAGVRDTFRRLKRMGYDAIQLSGSIAPMPTADLAAMLRDEGLTAPTSHSLAQTIIDEPEKDIHILLQPSDRLEISFRVEYGATPLDKQSFSCVVTPESFGRELADSRTFCIFRELEQLIAAGLVKGGSLDNAVVMHDGAIVSKEGMRHKEEFARHKMMDMVGDLYLTGMRVRARIASVKSGHPTHVKLAQEMLARYAAKQK